MTDHVAAHALAPEGYLFGCGPSPFDHARFYRREFKPAAGRIGLRDLRFHDLRHTYALLMDQQGEKVHHVSKWMGHSTIKITVDTYMRRGLFHEQDEAALRERPDAAFLSAPTTPPSTVVSIVAGGAT